MYSGNMYRKNFEFKEGVTVLYTELNWSISEILKYINDNNWCISWRIVSNSGQITIGPYKIKSSDEGKIEWVTINNIVMYSVQDTMCIYDYDQNIFTELKSDTSVIQITTANTSIVQKFPGKTVEYLKDVLENFIKYC